MAEEALVQGMRVLACTSEPGRDGGLSKAEDTLSGGRIEPFSQCRQDHGDLLGRGFQTIQRGVAPGSERDTAGLTAKGLDALGAAMLAIPDESMDGGVCDPKVWALWVRTGKALRVYVFRDSPPAFDLAPGAYRSRNWPCPLEGRRGETTSWAIVWAAGLQHTGKPAAHRVLCSRPGRTVIGPTQGTQRRQREDKQKPSRNTGTFMKHSLCLKSGGGPFPSEKVE